MLNIMARTILTVTDDGHGQQHSGLIVAPKRAGQHGNAVSTCAPFSPFDCPLACTARFVPRPSLWSPHRRTRYDRHWHCAVFYCSLDWWRLAQLARFDRQLTRRKRPRRHFWSHRFRQLTVWRQYRRKCRVMSPVAPLSALPVRCSYRARDAMYYHQVSNWSTQCLTVFLGVSNYL